MSTANTPSAAINSQTTNYTLVNGTDDGANFVITTAKTCTLYTANGNYAGYSIGAGQGVAKGTGQGVAYVSNDATSTANLSVAVASGEKLNGVTNGTLTLSPGQQVVLLSNGVNNWASWGVGGSVSGGRLVSYQQTCSYTSFTDGGGASGTLVLSHTIPAGAKYVQTLFSALTGFAGNVSATATLGDGSDVDRYNTGTPNFFTTAAAGVDAGAPSGTTFHASAISTVTLTVTSSSDFTSVNAGSVVVTLLYFSPFAST